MLITARDGTSRSTDPAFKAGVDDVVARLEARPRTSRTSARRSTTATRARSPRTSRRGARHVQHPRRRRPHRASASTPRSPPPRPRRRRTRTCGSSSSATRQRRQGARRLARRRLQAGRVPVSLPITLIDPDRRLRRARRRRRPAAAGHHRRDRHARPGRRRSARSSRWRSRRTRVILLIGLAVGVDYSMFYLRRKMEERDAGRSSEAALEFAAATSGRAVLVSGLTVMIAMAGMFLAGNAVVHVVRRRHDARRRRRDARQRHRPARRAVQARRQRREGPRAVHRPAAPPQPRRVARLGLGDRPRAHAPGRRPSSPPAACCSCSPSRRCTCTRSTRASRACRTTCRSCRPTTASRPSSPAARCPRVVVVEADDVTTPEVQKGIKELTDDAPSGPVEHDRRQPEQERRDRRHPAARQRHRRRRPTPRWPRCATTTIPATIDQVPGTKTNVTGMTAGSKDFNDRMNSRLPIVFAFVLGLAFLLLLVTFRSIVVPLKAIVLNLLSRRRRLRRARRGSSRTATSRACSASSRSAGSRRGCRCSCS